jgi:hypothetical protein
MHEFNWLRNLRFRDVQRLEHSWAFRFEGQTTLTAECLWRLLDNDQIIVTDRDDGHQFGRKHSVDVCRKVNGRLLNHVVEDVHLRPNVLDVTIRFSGGHTLELLPDSCGYEAWMVCRGGKTFVATAGGRIVVVEDA